jgi:outer membrane receptor protein involved in Fe transport
MSATYSRTVSRHGHRLGAVVLGLVLLVLGSGSLAAQNTLNLSGRVTGPDGEPLADAQIAVLDLATNQQRGAVANAEGRYIILGLAPGSYRISLVQLGYAGIEREIELRIGQNATLNFEMRREAVALGGLEARAMREPTLEVQRNDVSTPVIHAEIVNLPLNTRNTMNLAAIVPGMKTFAPTAGRSLPAAGSLPDLRFWNFYLDGVEWKSFFNGNLVGIPQTGSPLPQESMREFRVHLNPYDAAYTRGASFVMSAASQRGSNEFHGSVFAYGQNNDLNAHDMFQRRARASNPSTFKRPDYQRAQFGVNVRGPIQRDRVFFALSYEGQSTDNSIAVVPGRPAFNPGLWDGFAGSFAAPTKNHTGVARLTNMLDDEHTLDLTWASRFYDSETNFGGVGARSAGINARYWVHSGQLRDTFTPRPNMLNELSFNFLFWSHNESPLEPGPQRTYPSIRFGTAGFPLELKEQTFRLVDRFTYTPGAGRHTLTAGAEAAKVDVDAWLPSNRDGFFQYATDTSSVPRLGRIGLGVITGTEEDARANSKGWSTGLYVQDQWQIRRNFQLTFGVRWDAEINTLGNDFNSPFASDAELQAIPELQGFLNTGDRKNDLNNFAPRASFSWDVFDNGRSFVRGGAGIMYDRIATFMAFFEKQTAGWRSFDFQNPGTNDPAELREMVESGGGTSVPNLNLLRTDMKTPENRQFSIGIGQELAEGLVLNLDFVHQRARNLYVQVTPNWVNTTTGDRNLTNSYGTITLYDDFGEAKFSALVGGVTYHREGLRLNSALTLGWVESEFEGLGGYNDRSFFVMQPTAGDERARLVLSGIGDLPLGFRLSGVGIFATPRPYVATVGQDLNSDNNFDNDFIGGVGGRVIRPASDWEDMYRTVDLRLARSFRVRDGHAASLSLEAFNIFNWDNYSGFAGRRSDDAGNPLANFGRPSGVYAPRQAQVGIRYEF